MKEHFIFLFIAVFSASSWAALNGNDKKNATALSALRTACSQVLSGEEMTEACRVSYRKYVPANLQKVADDQIKNDLESILRGAAAAKKPKPIFPPFPAFPPGGGSPAST
jgi:hypothetical protein